MNKRKTVNKFDDDDEDDRRTDRAKANLGKELQFFEKVKSRLRNREAYQDLLKSLNLYNQVRGDVCRLWHTACDAMHATCGAALMPDEMMPIP